LFLSYVLNSETFQQFDGFEKLSDFEIDLKYPDNSTRLRTELADVKTGQDGKPKN
jgi:hypothetical protein